MTEVGEEAFFNCSLLESVLFKDATSWYSLRYSYVDFKPVSSKVEANVSDPAHNAYRFKHNKDALYKE